VKFHTVNTPEEYSSAYLIMKEGEEFHRVLLKKGDEIEISVKAKNGRKRKVERVHPAKRTI
jgi:hypothetical protein